MPLLANRGHRDEGIQARTEVHKVVLLMNDKLLVYFRARSVSCICDATLHNHDCIAAIVVVSEHLGSRGLCSIDLHHRVGVHLELAELAV